MRYHRILTPTLGAGLLLLGGSFTRANALTLMYSQTIPTAAVPYTYNFTLPTFDSTLGTLTGVTIDLSTSATAEVDVFNATGSSQSFTNAFANLPITVTGPDTSTASTTVSAGPLSGTANPGFNTFPGITGTGTGSTSVPSSGFALYQTPGGAPANFAAAVSGGTYGGTAAPGVFFSGSATAGGTVKITYTYTVPNGSVPEPGSVVLLCAGGISGAGVLLRRRKK